MEVGGEGARLLKLKLHSYKMFWAEYSMFLLQYSIR